MATQPDVKVLITVDTTNLEKCIAQLQKIKKPCLFKRMTMYIKKCFS